MRNGNLVIALSLIHSETANILSWASNMTKTEARNAKPLKETVGKT